MSRPAKGLGLSTGILAAGLLALTFADAQPPGAKAPMPMPDGGGKGQEKGGNGQGGEGQGAGQQQQQQKPSVPPGAPAPPAVQTPPALPGAFNPYGGVNPGAGGQNGQENDKSGKKGRQSDPSQDGSDGPPMNPYRPATGYVPKDTARELSQREAMLTGLVKVNPLSLYPAPEEVVSVRATMNEKQIQALIQAVNADPQAAVVAGVLTDRLQQMHLLKAGERVLGFTNGKVYALRAAK